MLESPQNSETVQQNFFKDRETNSQKTILAIYSIIIITVFEFPDVESFFEKVDHPIVFNCMPEDSLHRREF